eukprot:CAMPEP_0174945290 /NCGR_PEP_ID=MMETSP1355-20121228/81155_1 /TAXON_ID=464990 /ORGANISM="Hemiselmis tepida, Strain CCMP443" /LENGTH=217 /DNA_ID=CAMNT_0016192653 /DNA_START=56 /DNA_END=709 /DNA_ORIENTATION=+
MKQRYQQQLPISPPPRHARHGTPQTRRKRMTERTTCPCWPTSPNTPETGSNKPPPAPQRRSDSRFRAGAQCPAFSPGGPRYRAAKCAHRASMSPRAPITRPAPMVQAARNSALPSSAPTAPAPASFCPGPAAASIAVSAPTTPHASLTTRSPPLPNLALWRRGGPLLLLHLCGKGDVLLNHALRALRGKALGGHVEGVDDEGPVRGGQVVDLVPEPR